MQPAKTLSNLLTYFREKWKQKTTKDGECLASSSTLRTKQLLNAVKCDVESKRPFHCDSRSVCSMVTVQMEELVWQMGGGHWAGESLSSRVWGGYQ